MNVIKCGINEMIFDGLLLRDDNLNTLTAQPFFPHYLRWIALSLGYSYYVEMRLGKVSSDRA